MRSTTLLMLMLMLMLALAEFCYAQDYCGDTVYNDTVGSVHSPGFPTTSYLPFTNCTYRIEASKLSSISLTFQVLALEYNSNCSFDWVQVGCVSHQAQLPLRYCGKKPPNETMIFSPCTKVEIALQADSSIGGTGFSFDYEVTQIECTGNCTPVSNSYGYFCPCDTHRTNASLPTSRPLPSCPSDCMLEPDGTFCICPGASLYTSTLTTCPPGCTPTTNFFGNPICNCEDSTTPSSTSCAPGCYRTTDWLGYLTCNCPSTTYRPLVCSYGCHSDTDYWGTPYCSCPSSTQPQIWCSSGCTRQTDAYGNAYCDCPTTTLPPCFSPCYYSWNYTYDYSGRAFCYCPTTTTNPPPTGCNQTLTATYGTVTSPNYPNMYPKGIDCVQKILVPMATSITLKLIEINVYFYDSYSCAYEYIEITGCDGSYNVYCTSVSFPTPALVFQCSDSSLVSVNFHTSASSYSGFRGFKLVYSANFGSNCTDSGVYVSNGDSGSLTSPGFPKNFPSYSECYNYIFTDDDNVVIKITFEQLRLEESSNCHRVSLRLSCQDETNFTREICGSRIPGAMTFNCRALQIWFRSNSTNLPTTRGYKLRYYGMSNQPSTLSALNGPTQAAAMAIQTDLPQSTKIGIGLGVGVGGFFLIILIIIIIVLIVSGQRQAARRDQRHLEDLAVICRNISGKRGSDAGGSVRFCRAPPDGGFVNPIHEMNYPESLPSYSSAAGSQADTSSIGGFTAEVPKSKLMD